MSSPNEETWNEAIEQCVEGVITPDELSTMLMRIDLPEEGRRAINDTLTLVNGLDQSLRVPEPSSGAVSRLLEGLRSEPLPAGLLSISDLRSAETESPKISDLPETDDASEAREFQELSDALDSFHRSMPMPGGARDRLLARLGKGDDSMDVRAFFDAGDSADQSADDSVSSIPFPRYPVDGTAMRDVLAASRETPPASEPTGPRQQETKSSDLEGEEPGEKPVI